MSGLKELFNQGQIPKISRNQRIAAGVPRQEGCDNLTALNFIKSFFYVKTQSLASGTTTVNFVGFEANNINYLILTNYGGGYQITNKTINGFDIELMESAEITFFVVDIS